MIHAAWRFFTRLALNDEHGCATGKMNISALLQDNRRSLDASPEIVASRFGVECLRNPGSWPQLSAITQRSQKKLDGEKSR